MKTENENKNPVSKRINQVILFYELTLADFAVKIGSSRQNLSGMLHKANYSRHLYDQLVQRYPDINEVWLKTGKGCPFKCGESKHETQSADNSHTVRFLIEEQQQQIENQQKIIDYLTKTLLDTNIKWWKQPLNYWQQIKYTFVIV